MSNKRSYSAVGMVIASPLTRSRLFLLLIYDKTDEFRTQQLREDFLLNASHELRSPLTSIRGYTEAALDRLTDDSLRTYLEAILRNATRMERLVEDMASLAALESRAEVFRPERVQVQTLLGRIAELASGSLNSQHIQLSIQCKTNLEAELDPILMEHLFLNLLDNAGRHSPDGETIELSASLQPEGHILFSVADRGPGIPEGLLERIFERFYRADLERSRQAGGTGLGLSIARHIVRAHSGRIWAENRPDGGALFQIRLPSQQPGSISSKRK